MNRFSDGVYTEPSTVDVHTLDNLGPLRGMAGVWEGRRGLDVKHKAVHQSLHRRGRRFASTAAAGLSADERRQLVALLDKVRRRLDPAA